MKTNTLLYIGALALAASVATGCDDDFARPPMVYPVSDWQANMTIEDFKKTYWSTVEGTAQTVGLDANGDSIVIKGRVCSSDASGNIFKTLYIQGETEAIAISLDFYDIYESYKYGQEVYINVTGMTIGGYNGLMQLGKGTDDRGRVARAPEAFFSQHAQASGLPSPAKVDTTTTTLSVINTAKSTPEGLELWQGRLVRFDGLRFEDAGKGFTANNATTDRYAVDAEGNRINVRNSSYADFKDELLPYGTGSVTGILSYYGSNWQLLLNDAAGLSDFNGVASPVFSPEGGIVEEGTTVTISCPTEGATIYYTVDGTEPTVSSTQYSQPVTVNADMTIKAIAAKEGMVTSSVATAAYTIGTPIVSGDGTEASPFSASHVAGMTTEKDVVAATGVWVKGYIVGSMPGTNTFLENTIFGPNAEVASNIVVADSPTETDPSKCIPVQLVSGSAARTALNLKDHPENIGAEVVLKGDITKYCGASGLKQTSEYKLNGEGPDVPVQSGETVFEETFGSSQGQFTFENSDLTAGLEYIWSYDSKYKCVKASTFKDNVNQKGTAWMISPVIDLTGRTGVELTFEQAFSKHFGDGEAAKPVAEKICTVWVRVDGGEWEQITGYKYPDFPWSFNFGATGAISLSKYEGKKIEVGFKYSLATAGEPAGTWELKNFRVSAAK